MSAVEKYFDTLTNNQKRHLTIIPKNPFPKEKELISQKKLDEMAKILISFGYTVVKP